MIQQTDAFRLLVHLTRQSNDPVLIAVMADSDWLGLINWDAFKTLAIEHRVEGLIASNLSAFPDANVPENLRSYFARRHRKFAIRSLANGKATVELSRSFDAADIQHILLKGASIAGWLYRPEELRQSIDIDLWIKTADLTEARTVIENLGFRQTFPSYAEPENCLNTLLDFYNTISYFREADGAAIDLHWRLSKNPKLIPNDFENSYDASGQLKIADHTLRVLSTIEQMTYLYAHGAKDGWHRLKWLADAHRLNQTLSNETARFVFERAKREKALRLVATGIMLEAYFYNDGKIPETLAEFAPYAHHGLLEKMLRSVLETRLFDRVTFGQMKRVIGRFRYDFWLKPSLPYRTFMLKHYLINADDINTLKLSRTWLPVYMFAGPILAMSRILKRTFFTNRS